MRIVLLFTFQCICAAVSANQAKPPPLEKLLEKNKLHEQMLATALSQIFLNKDTRQKFTEEMGKYIVNSASNSLDKFNITVSCVKDTVEFMKGILEAHPWAMQMLDSYGKLPSGIIRGTVGSLGDYDTCLGVTVQKLNQKKTQFQGKYCLVNVLPLDYKIGVSKFFNKADLQPSRHWRKLQPQTAICIPSTCTVDDVQNLLLKITPILGLDLRVKTCETLHDEKKVTWSDKLFIFFLSTLLFIVIIATIYHLTQEFSDAESSEKENKSPDGFLLHFSLLKNAQKLFKKDNNPDSIKAFHGIRVLSAIWIFVVHVITVMHDQAFGGLHSFFNLRHSIWGQLIPMSTMAVETFFFMSAVLLAYNIMKNKDRHMTVGLVFQGRYVRTTIPLLFMIASVCLLPFLASGPLYKEIVGKETENCQQRGWINLFYIQNFIPFQKMCLVSTWYLAADTQLFFLSLFVLIPFRKKPETLVKLIIGLLLFGLIGKIICTIVFHLPPTPLYLDPTFENLSYVWQRSYFSPIFHLSTYSIGMLVGYILATKKQLNVSKITSAVLWLASISTLLIIVIGVYCWNSQEEPPGLVPSLLYGVSHRVLWSLSLAWITYSCQTNEKNLISRFLGAEAFVPFSRITYMALLTNFTVNHLYLGTTRSLIIYDFRTMMTVVITVTTLTFFVSAILTLIFESPFMSLEKSLLQKLLDKKKSKKDKSENKSD